MEIQIEKLKELCINYDDYFGNYPESQFEGVAVFNFICEKLGLKEKLENLATMQRIRRQND